MSSGSSTTATRRARSSGFLARCHGPWPIALHVVSIPASKSSSSRRSRERRSRCRCPSTPATTLLASRTTSAAPAGAWTSDSEIVTLSGWSAAGRRLVGGWSAAGRRMVGGYSNVAARTEQHFGCSRSRPSGRARTSLRRESRRFGRSPRHARCDLWHSAGNVW